MEGRVLRKIKRGVVILMAAAIVFGIGLHVQPSGNQVDAMVFEPWMSYAKSMPAYLFEQNERSEPRRIVVNGITTNLTVQQSDDDIDAILDFYAARFQPLVLNPDVYPFAQALEHRLSADMAKKALNALTCMHGTRPIRHQRENFGVWGAFEFRQAGQTPLPCAFIQLLNDALESGNIGKIGQFKIAMALKGGQQGKTRIVTLWTDETLNLKNLHPDASGDMPGNDIEDIPRFAGALRQLSIAQENQTTLDRVVVYASEGSILHHLLYYHSKMANNGWQSDVSSDKTGKDTSRGKVMFFKRKGRECSISINRKDDTGNIIITIMDRKAIHA